MIKYLDKFVHNLENTKFYVENTSGFIIHETRDLEEMIEWCKENHIINWHNSLMVLVVNVDASGLFYRKECYELTHRELKDKFCEEAKVRKIIVSPTYNEIYAEEFNLITICTENYMTELDFIFDYNILYGDYFDNFKDGDITESTFFPTNDPLMHDFLLPFKFEVNNYAAKLINKKYDPIDNIYVACICEIQSKLDSGETEYDSYGFPWMCIPSATFKKI